MPASRSVHRANPAALDKERLGAAHLLSRQFPSRCADVRETGNVLPSEYGLVVRGSWPTGNCLANTPCQGRYGRLSSRLAEAPCLNKTAQRIPIQGRRKCHAPHTCRISFHSDSGTSASCGSKIGIPACSTCRGEYFGRGSRSSANSISHDQSSIWTGTGESGTQSRTKGRSLS